MGAYLSAPITLKESEDGATSRLRHGASSMQGWRRSMEDAHIVGTEKAGATLYGVFDGHGGAEVARYVARHMAEDFPEDWSANPEQALKGLFHRMDERLRLPENQPELASLKNGATAPGAGQLQGANLCGNQPVCRVHGDDVPALAPSSGEEPTPPRYRAGVVSMAWRTTRRFSTNAP